MPDYFNTQVSISPQNIVPEWHITITKWHIRVVTLRNHDLFYKNSSWH